MTVFITAISQPWVSGLFHPNIPRRRFW